MMTCLFDFDKPYVKSVFEVENFKSYYLLKFSFNQPKNYLESRESLMEKCVKKLKTYLSDCVVRHWVFYDEMNEHNVGSIFIAFKGSDGVQQLERLKRTFPNIKVETLKCHIEYVDRYESDKKHNPKCSLIPLQDRLIDTGYVVRKKYTQKTGTRKERNPKYSRWAKHHQNEKVEKEYIKVKYTYNDVSYHIECVRTLGKSPKRVWPYGDCTREYTFQEIHTNAN